MKSSLFVVSLSLGAALLSAQQVAPPSRGRATTPPSQVLPGPPTAPLPAGAKIAFVNVQYIAASSIEGKAANGKVNALVQKKQTEAAAQKTPQDQQRFQQTAQAEVQKLQTDLQTDFQKKLLPVLQQMAQDKHLSLLLSAADAGIIWAEPGLDLTGEAMKRFDATAAPAAK